MACATFTVITLVLPSTLTANMRIYQTTVFFLFSIMSCFTTKAQFYYKDVVSNETNLANYQLHKKNKLVKITGESFEATGEPTTDFVFTQQYNSSYSQLKTLTVAPLSGKSAMTSYYNGQGQLYRSTDSSETSFTQYDYNYDSTGKLTFIKSSSNIIGERNKTVESHQWIYNSKGIPEKMIRVKDQRDSTVYMFVSDENGKVIEEQPVIKGNAGEKTFYYYDESGRLSDIVRYNSRAGKLLPDYIFNYGEDGKLIEMITVQDGGTDYLTWRYKYEDNGIKSEELCYNKLKRLVGKLIYKNEYKK